MEDRTTGLPAQPIENLKTDKKPKGGKRPGSGRKKKLETLIRRGLQELIDEHGKEEVELQILDKATGKVLKIKRPRIIAMLDVLGREGLKGNVTAAKEYMDRQLGKAAQSVKLSGAVDTMPQQRPPTPAEQAAAEAYEDADE